jgi:hypothetical protein
MVYSRNFVTIYFSAGKGKKFASLFDTQLFFQCITDKKAKDRCMH